MSVADSILTAAEARVRQAGYNGFSFRDIARDTGLTNAGVHHYFPTKTDLVVRLSEVYAERFVSALLACAPGARAARLRDLFAASLREDGRMCLCGLLASESGALPEALVRSVRAFFDDLAGLLAEGLAEEAHPRNRALAILAQLEGAAVLATVFADSEIFERATRDVA